MARFEQFAPLLRPGRLIPQGSKLVYETEAPFDQLILPIEMIDFLLLCNGERSVGDIIETIYHRKGTIQFKMIYHTLLLLRDRGLLENARDLEVQNSTDPNREYNFLTFRPLVYLPIGKRIFNDKDHPKIFYAFAMLFIISAILTFNLYNEDWLTSSFLWVNDKFSDGLLFLFIASSVLLSAKNIFKTLMLLFLTGRAYNFGVAFNGIALYFRVRSDSLFLVSNKFYLLLFHLAVVLSYFPITMAIYFILPNLPFHDHAMGLAFLLFIFDLNPFQDSELTQFLKSSFNDDMMNRVSNYVKNRSFLSFLHPFESERIGHLYFYFSHLSVLWSIGILYCFYQASSYHFTNLTEAIHTASGTEQIVAVLVASFLFSTAAVTTYNLIRLLYFSMIVPVSGVLLRIIRSQKSKQVGQLQINEILRALEELPLLSYFSPEVLNNIVRRSQVKEYEAKTPIIVQGDEGTHLYVCLSGKLLVQKRLATGRIAAISEIHPTSIFGEIAVIEETPRKAEVVAIEKSTVLEIPARILRQIASESQAVRELDAFKNAIIVNQFFMSAPLFREISENVRQMFMLRGKIENFKKDQIIFRQGEHADGFFLLLRGSVNVVVNQRQVSKIHQGGFFGEISMIADIPRTGTIYATEPVQTLKISRDAFWEILAMDINIAMFIESVGEMRVREDIEILRGGKVAG